jgi:hypothetical protein
MRPMIMKSKFDEKTGLCKKRIYSTDPDNVCKFIVGIYYFMRPTIMKSKFDKNLNFVKEFIVQIQILFTNLLWVFIIL